MYIFDNRMYKLRNFFGKCKLHSSLYALIKKTKNLYWYIYTVYRKIFNLFSKKSDLILAWQCNNNLQIVDIVHGFSIQ